MAPASTSAASCSTVTIRRCTASKTRARTASPAAAGRVHHRAGGRGEGERSPRPRSRVGPPGAAHRDARAFARLRAPRHEQARHPVVRYGREAESTEPRWSTRPAHRRPRRGPRPRDVAPDRPGRSPGGRRRVHAAPVPAERPADLRTRDPAPYSCAGSTGSAAHGRSRGGVRAGSACSEPLRTHGGSATPNGNLWTAPADRAADVDSGPGGRSVGDAVGVGGGRPDDVDGTPTPPPRLAGVVTPMGVPMGAPAQAATHPHRPGATPPRSLR